MKLYWYWRFWGIFIGANFFHGFRQIAVELCTRDVTCVYLLHLYIVFNTGFDDHIEVGVKGYLIIKALVQQY